MKYKKGNTVEHTKYKYLGNIEKVYKNFLEVESDLNEFISMSSEEWL